MKTSRFEFLVEEPSMEAFLNAVLPDMLPDDTAFEIHAFQGKQALLRKLEDRLKGYARFMTNDHRVMVIVDQDNDDCKDLKSRLENACANAGLRSKRVAATPNWQIATRIAIEELEAWYFGNWLAVCAAYPRVPENTPKNKRYRNPDAIRDTWENFERILKQAGYCKQGMRKVEVATKIGAHFDPGNCTSRSFEVFQNAVDEAG